jgi:flagellar biosynthesis/type III secretory pathway protein FliH
MVKYYQHDEITLARDLRWMGIILRRTDCVTEEEKQMIQERLSMYDDLMENDPEMQRLRAKYKTEGMAEGMAKGISEGMAEGEVKALRTTILTFVKARFPALAKQARQRISHMKDVDDLQDLFEQLVSVSDEASANELLASPLA